MPLVSLPVFAKSKFPMAQQVGAMAVVVILAAVAGLILKALHGFEIPKIGRFKGYKVKPVIRYIAIPPLIGMILLGFVARNFIGGFMLAYPSRWATFIRLICLCLILMRGGLNVHFKG
jgi:hypothetical protein